MRSLFALALGLCVLAKTHVALAQCTMDTECKGERVCNAGVCEAPRAVALPPPVVAPAPPQFPPPVAYRRNSTALMVTGIVTASLGVASLASGLGLAIASVDCTDRLDEPTASRSHERDCSGYATAAEATVIIGLVMTGVGVPLLIIGARKVPTATTATLTPIVGAHVAGLRVSFEL